MEHLYSCRLCFDIGLLGQQGEMDGFCKIFRKKLRQILVVGIDDIFLDGLDFRFIHTEEQGIHFFPSVPVWILRTFPYGSTDGVDVIGSFRACHRIGQDFCRHFLRFRFGKEVLPYDLHAHISHTCTESRFV